MVGSQSLMSIAEKLNKQTFHCDMCTKYYVNGERYIYKTWELKEKPSIDLIVCRKCAIRECGTKHKKLFDERF
tara:strand:- start:2438 stop:2656 length:219 start_codon:yes stop_codon:yes gene_type:complete